MLPSGNSNLPFMRIPRIGTEVERSRTASSLAGNFEGPVPRINLHVSNQVK